MKNGRCRMHGGKSLRGMASPRYRHGLYTKEALGLRRQIATLVADAKRTLGSA